MGSESEQIPDRLPRDPMPLVKAWLEEARTASGVRNSNAMCLATTDSHGQPSARMVLCKGLDLERGFVVFYTNYESRKGLELAANPRAVGVFHWDNMGRQVRLAGQAVKSPDTESDAYFRSRDRDSRIGAWASAQSEPVGSRKIMQQTFRETAQRYADADSSIPRPAHWGGYRLWLNEIELWLQGAARIHDRASWTREMNPSADGFNGGDWRAQRLQP